MHVAADEPRAAPLAPISADRGMHLTGLCQVSGSPGPGRPWALDAGWVTSPGRRVG
jgi:hypothetical protein